MRMHSIFFKEIERLRRLLIGMGINFQDGEDILQDVYLEALRRPPKFQGEVENARWLMRVTINKCMLKFRQEKRSQRAKNEFSQRCAGQEITQPGPEKRIIHSEETFAMKQCLDEMDESFRVPLVMKYFCGLNSSQISEIMELKSGTVRKRLFEGRLILAEMLSKKGIKS
ncbi:MAG: RNA polymerase sigma factor [Sedimentisphaerales bacterium]|nr:RNA polymerase sigma factor [Sedimentisphaerales bacterium]